MNKRYESICITRKAYRTDADYKAAIGELITLLQQNDYTIVITRREFDAVLIQYNYADPQMGTPLPVWLTPEEEETVQYEEGDE